jgi:hypothetical protein
MLIEIAETHPPQYGRKMAHVIAASGETFEVYPRLLALMKIGGQYKIDVAEREFQGRVIKKITKVESAAAARANGYAAPNGHAPPAASPPPQGGRVSPQAGKDCESEFVGRALAALIAGGHVPYDNKALFDATNVLRGLYGATFGARRHNGNGGPA